LAVPLVVVDTTVVVGAVLGRPHAPNAQVLREAATGGVRLALSDNFLSEVVRKMRDPEVEERIGSAGRAFEIALDLAFHGCHYRPLRRFWYGLRDPNDWWVLDLAYESGADYIVTGDSDIIEDAPALGFEVRTPPELLQELRTVE
jgi:putative PIN family toxin of toxin-antitoxin system